MPKPLADIWRDDCAAMRRRGEKIPANVLREFDPDVEVFALPLSSLPSHNDYADECEEHRAGFWGCP